MVKSSTWKTCRSSGTPAEFALCFRQEVCQLGFIVVVGISEPSKQELSTTVFIRV